MAQVITFAGEQLFATKAQNNQPLDIDTFIFAMVPGQDPNAPINRAEALPPIGQRVHTQIVQQTGKVNQNVVIYSTVLDSTTGPFEFNWVGLYSSVNSVLVAIQHIPTTPKTITVPGAAGNTLNRNFGIEYSGIAELTGITVEPETWQLDYTARLNGMDELTRQLAADMNGKDWFIGDGFKVEPRSTLNTFKVIAGAGYVSGLRIELEEDHILTLSAYPRFVYVDAWFDGTSESQWKGQVAFTVTNAEMEDYIDVNGKNHYVFKLANITAAESVTDMRGASALAQAKRQFGTVNTLKSAFGLQVGQVVETRGYSDETDGLGAVYEIVPPGSGATTDGKFEALTASGLQAKKIDGVRNYLNNRYDESGQSMVDWANFPEVVRRLLIMHHYNDAEVSVIDNVGDSNVFFLLRNASNPARRYDKDEFFVGTADFLRFQNRFWDAGISKLASVFEIKYDGKMVWGNQAVTPRNNGVTFENAQVTSNNTYSFTLKTNVDTNPRLLDIKASEDKSAYRFNCIGGTLAKLIIPEEMTSGFTLAAAAGNLDLDAEDGLLRLYAKDAKSYFVRTDTGFGFLGKHLDAASAPNNLTANPGGWSTAKGERGDFFASGDGAYLYFCYAPNLWCRMPASIS